MHLEIPYNGAMLYAKVFEYVKTARALAYAITRANEFLLSCLVLFILFGRAQVLDMHIL